MRKLSLQWRLTILTTVLITVLCGCLTFFLYKNGVYYIDTLQETVTDQGKTPEALYIEIPDNEWDNFASQFATECRMVATVRCIIRNPIIETEVY